SHTKALPNALGFPNQHIRDCSVNRVVLAEEHHGANFRTILPEAVYASVSLLMTCRIPGEVVMQHSIEMLLKVNALGEAISRHQDPFRMTTEVFHTLLTLRGWKQSGDSS